MKQIEIMVKDQNQKDHLFVYMLDESQGNFPVPNDLQKGAKLKKRFRPLLGFRALFWLIKIYLYKMSKFFLI